jgi:hypothetical protein
MGKKITKTYSIDENTYKLFENLSITQNINKSSFIEKSIKNYLKDNINYSNDKYYHFSDKKYIVSIVETDDTYFKLSDGSKISQILFYQTFKKINK